ncbi:adenylyltransferase/cytidyltransferase family protein [Methanofollis fontis]|uniref:FAD synthase n=1 Tax=Methanofollis fontis TaxID=2052832 RepID=A0A483CWL8_9EURY|nr:adenylyltransferase/cytidyltransferase family protein [Methanofollis fontis]TAJ45610.1 FAD synthase [Methanofollis fontis]
MRRIVATGTFDILHPGHLFYLAESKRLGDELHVIVARDANVRHKPAPIIPEEQRCAMVQALKPVDHARLGDPVDIFAPIREIDPDVITLGFNQYFREGDLREALRERGLRAEVVRIGRYDGLLASSSQIVGRILSERCPPSP